MGLAFIFTACEDNDVIDVTVNPQPAIFNIENLKVAPTTESAGTLDLKGANDSGSPIALATVQVTDFPSDYELQFVMQLSGDESFARVNEVPVTVIDDVLTVNPSDLQGVYYANISKGPKARTVYARYAAYAAKGQTVVRLGDPTLYYGPYALEILPYPSSLVIEDHYYLLGTVNGWSVANAIPFNHSGNNPYDDPVFTLGVNITPEQAAGGWWWKIVPESTYVTGNWVDGNNASFGVAENGSPDLSGMLVPRTATEDCGAGCITEAGTYLLTINLEEGTYDFSLTIENLYTPGNSNGWSQTASQKLFTNDYANYMGYAYLDGEFKFTSQPDWNGINYGNAGEEGKLSNDGGAGNLNAGGAGLFWCRANIAAMTYSLTAVNSMALIGSATPGGWDAETPLSPDGKMLKWTGTVTLGEGEFKIRANNGWDINLGGAMTDLQPDAANIASPGAGTWNVTLDLSQLPYTVTFTK